MAHCCCVVGLLLAWCCCLRPATASTGDSAFLRGLSASWRVFRSAVSMFWLGGFKSEGVPGNNDDRVAVKTGSNAHRAPTACMFRFSWTSTFKSITRLRRDDSSWKTFISSSIAPQSISTIIKATQKSIPTLVLLHRGICSGQKHCRESSRYHVVYVESFRCNW